MTARFSFARSLSAPARRLYSPTVRPDPIGDPVSLDLQPGGTVRVTVTHPITRASAKKTLERLFMTDKAIAGPIEAREKNFKAKPKRRGGTIWTKFPNKVHPTIDRGTAATIRATPQHVRDLNSVASFVEVAKA